MKIDIRRVAEPGMRHNWSILNFFFFVQMQITKQWEEHLFYEYRSICATSETEERMITIYFGACRIVLYLQMKIVWITDWARNWRLPICRCILWHQMRVLY